LLQVDGTPGMPPQGMAGIGVVVREPSGAVKTWHGAVLPARTCNEAEYQAVICGLRLVLQRYPLAQVRCLSDSQIVIEQLNGRSAVRASALQPLHAQATMLMHQLVQVEFVFIPRELNRLADALAWEALGGRQQLVRLGSAR
jgi:ribonuclease HI